MINFKKINLDKMRHLAMDEIDLPDPLLREVYVQSARHNVMAAAKPHIYEGFFSVAVDGKKHGGDKGTTFPGLDWGQILEALLWLGQHKKVLSSWNYVKSFVRSDGKVPFAISPLDAGVGNFEKNGALFKHWCPGNPLRMLANLTMLQVADSICRHNLDKDWLRAESPLLQKVVSWLESELITQDHLVRGAGYYVERPMRVEYDGVAQCCTSETLRRTSELFRWIGLEHCADRYERTAEQIALAFSKYFWTGDRFAEYIHPDRGPIALHGYTDVDWAAIATGLASPEQLEILWPKLKVNKDFYYDGMPTGIATSPDAYEPWEWEGTDRHDLAAMGRVWYWEAWARTRMRDAEGLIGSLRRVAEHGKKRNWYWLERYYSPITGDVGAGEIDTYLEYPANLIRIINQFVIGIRMELDGSVTVNPCVTKDIWQQGFGRTLSHCGKQIPFFCYNKGLEVDSEYANIINISLKPTD